MRKFIFIGLAALLLCFVQIGIAQAQPNNSLTVNVTDKRKVITRSISKNLLLRVVKDSSVNHKDFGWLVEVVKKPYGEKSPNLIYMNKAGITADQSQVYAWHVADGEFPNERRIKVRGYPYEIKISLLDMEITGSGPEAGFVSGQIQISWSR